MASSSVWSSLSPVSSPRAGSFDPPRLFHGRGLAYFWCFNDQCDLDDLKAQADAYAQGGMAAVCLHPRPGLLFPYGGSAWFELIRQVVTHCIGLGLEVWLYDEDPYPSGHAGGRLLMEHPEYQCHGLELDVADLSQCRDGLFAFAPGKLQWCGVVDEHDQPVLDLTADVGVVRRRWVVHEVWDSTHYYPATPVFPCPRAKAMDPELAVKLPTMRPGQRLVAIVARPQGQGSDWGALVDSLNPDATQKFIEMTHERYRQTVGEFFGQGITAMFTDEAKLFHRLPWTADLPGDYQREHRQDLRPRLIHLFGDQGGQEAMLTRLRYRQWCTRRFEQAWMQPVSRWCKDHGLALVGHISPEDDPVQQSACLGNLFPLQKYFSLAGLDLIIPATGDSRHGLINIGVILATSVQQQQGKPGVMSEMLGVSGLDMTGDTARRIVFWQTMMGVTTPVIHAGYNSVEGPRLIDAPPDSGPKSAVWPDMIEISRDIQPVQEAIIGARQVAPVAILWPIRTFNARTDHWQPEPGGLRGDLVDLITLALNHQVGVHLLDEADLVAGDCRDGWLHVGQAAYRHVLIPSCTMLHADTITKLKQAREAGLDVQAVGQLPGLAQCAQGLSSADMAWCPRQSAREAVEALPRLLPLDGPVADLRCTAWEKGGVVRHLLMNLHDQPVTLTLPAGKVELQPDELRILEG